MSITTLTATKTLRSALVKSNSLTTRFALILGGTAFIALMAQLSFPIPGSPVPFTGQTLAVLLVGGAYGAGLGTASTLAYVALGAAGLPIFTSGTHGLNHLTGATGGYLVGMIVASCVTGALAVWEKDFVKSIPAMLLGDLIIFGFGLTWLQHATGMSWSMTVAKGFTPFALAELIKIAIAATSLPTAWKFIK